MPSLTSIPTAMSAASSFPGGTQDLQTFISGVARDIQDPETHMSVFQRSHLAGIAQAKDADERSDLRKRSDLVVHALGDGSDFTAFQDFAGISTLSVEFGDEDDGTQYHSIYDDFYWYTHFVDTDFCLRTRSGANRRHSDDAAGRCRPDSRGLLSAGRGHCEIRERISRSCLKTSRTNSPSAICNCRKACLRRRRIRAGPRCRLRRRSCRLT